MSALRLVDRFRAVLDERGVEMPGEVRECGVFADLMWPPCGDLEYVKSRVIADPAFIIFGFSRYIALAWVIDEIRFFAARIEPLTDFADDPTPERIAALAAESEDYELAIFENLDDAVTFTLAYLAGAALGDIEVVRIRPTPER